MTHDPDADAILRHYISHSAHIGQAAEKLAIDFAAAIRDHKRDEADISAGFVRRAPAVRTRVVEDRREPL